MNQRLTGALTICYSSSRFVSAAVAQSVERVLGKDEVTGSIPVSSFKTHTFPLRMGVRFLLFFVCVIPHLFHVQ